MMEKEVIETKAVIPVQKPPEKVTIAIRRETKQTSPLRVQTLASLSLVPRLQRGNADWEMRPRHDMARVGVPGVCIPTEDRGNER